MSKSDQTLIIASLPFVVALQKAQQRFAAPTVSKIVARLAEDERRRHQRVVRH